jgi:predicted RNA-binding protein with PUA-like domain
MQRWLFKSDPDDYSISDLKRDGETIWTGIANPTARLHLRSVTPGDQILIYQTGKERAAVGLAEAVSGPIPDPTSKDEKAVAVEIRFVRELPKPLPLTQIRSDKAFANWDLLKQSRLSVVPISEKIWARVIELTGK